MNGIDNVGALGSLNYFATWLAKRHPGLIAADRLPPTWVASFASVISFEFIGALRAPVLPRSDAVSRGIPKPDQFRHEVLQTFAERPDAQGRPPAAADIAQSIASKIRAATADAPMTTDLRNSVRTELKDMARMAATDREAQASTSLRPGDLTLAERHLHTLVAPALQSLAESLPRGDGPDTRLTQARALMQESFTQAAAALAPSALAQGVDAVSMGLHGAPPLQTESFTGSAADRLKKAAMMIPAFVASETARGAVHGSIQHAMGSLGNRVPRQNPLNSAVGDVTGEFEKEVGANLVRVMQGMTMKPTPETQLIWGHGLPALLRPVGHGVSPFLEKQFGHEGAISIRTSLQNKEVPALKDVRSLLSTQAQTGEALSRMTAILTPAFAGYGWFIAAASALKPSALSSTGRRFGSLTTDKAMRRTGGSAIAAIGENSWGPALGRTGRAGVLAGSALAQKAAGELALPAREQKLAKLVSNAGKLIDFVQSTPFAVDPELGEAQRLPQLKTSLEAKLESAKTSRTQVTEHAKAGLGIWQNYATTLRQQPEESLDHKLELMTDAVALSRQAHYAFNQSAGDIKEKVTELLDPAATGRTNEAMGSPARQATYAALLKDVKDAM